MDLKIQNLGSPPKFFKKKKKEKEITNVCVYMYVYVLILAICFNKSALCLLNNIIDFFKEL